MHHNIMSTMKNEDYAVLITLHILKDMTDNLLRSPVSRTPHDKEGCMV